MLRFLWLMFHYQESLASSNLGFVGQEAGRRLVMSFQEKLMSLSLDAEGPGVEPRLAIDFLWKVTTGLLNLDLVAEQAAGRRLVMRFPEKLTNRSPDAEEPGVEPRLVIGFLWRVMMGLLSLDLVAEQGAGRRLVMNLEQKTVSLSLDIAEELVYPRWRRMATTKMGKKRFGQLGQRESELGVPSQRIAM